MVIDEAVYVEHFGKKGMKWGVRKAPTPTRASKNNPRISSQTGNPLLDARVNSYMEKNGVRTVADLHRHNKRQERIGQAWTVASLAALGATAFLGIAAAKL